MKRFILSLVGAALVFMLGGFGLAKEAQAQISVEVLGKLGGVSTFIENERYGDSIFDVGGGLNFAGIVRFEQGFGIGLNLNWTMVDQRLKRANPLRMPGSERLTKREMVVQHPSFGVTARYFIADIFDLGLWLNYGFGNVKMKFSPSAELGPLNLIESFKWSAQSFDFGLIGQVAWLIPNTDLSVLFGGHIFGVVSRLYADGTSQIEENSLFTMGFTINIGVRYDFYFESFGKQKSRGL
ncbi:MAG: hypothetical protein WC966_07080 [Bradymonadales bacterium]|jgi:hypothetical protein